MIKEEKYVLCSRNKNKFLLEDEGVFIERIKFVTVPITLWNCYLGFEREDNTLNRYEYLKSCRIGFNFRNDSSDDF